MKTGHLSDMSDPLTFHVNGNQHTAALKMIFLHQNASLLVFLECFQIEETRIPCFVPNIERCWTI